MNLPSSNQNQITQGLNMSHHTSGDSVNNNQQQQLPQRQPQRQPQPQPQPQLQHLQQRYHHQLQPPPSQQLQQYQPPPQQQQQQLQQPGNGLPMLSQNISTPHLAGAVAQGTSYGQPYLGSMHGQPSTFRPLGSQLISNNLSLPVPPAFGMDVGTLHMMQERPVKHAKRRRVAKACAQCKRHKIKCDGLLPCARCKKHGQICKYTGPLSGQANSKQAESDFFDYQQNDQLQSSNTNTPNSNYINTREPTIADRDGYGNRNGIGDDNCITSNGFNVSKPGNDETATDSVVSALLSRISDLESRLSQKPLEKSISHAYTNTANTTNKNLPKQQKVEAELLEKVFDTSMKTRIPHRSLLLLTPGFGSYIHQYLSTDSQKQITAPRVQNYGFNLGGRHYLKSRTITNKFTLFEKLNRQEVDSLVEFYFKEVNPFFTIVHEKVFMDIYRKTLDISYPPTSKPLVLFAAITSLICAIAVRFSESTIISSMRRPDLMNFSNLSPGVKFKFTASNKNNKDTVSIVSSDNKWRFILGLEEQMFEESYKILETISFDWESVEIVQGWLLVSFYLRACSRQVSIFNILGRAVRMSQGLGMSIDPANYKSMMKYHVLKMKRIFCSCYTIDILFSNDCCRVQASHEPEIEFPSFELWESELKDGWCSPITLCLIHVANAISKIRPISSLYDNSPEELEHAQALLNDLQSYSEKYNLHSDTILCQAANISPPIVAHYRITYYDAVITINVRKLLPLCIDSDEEVETAQRGRSLFKCLEASRGIITVMESLKSLNVGNLLRPWWNFLKSVYDATVIAIILTNSNLYMKENCQGLIKRGVDLICFYSKDVEEFNLPQFREGSGKMGVNKIDIDSTMFRLATECEWATKTLNKMVFLHLKELSSSLVNVGLDEGSADINKERFHERGRFENNGFVESVAESHPQKSRRSIDSLVGNNQSSNMPFSGSIIKCNQNSISTTTSNDNSSGTPISPHTKLRTSSSLYPLINETHTPPQMLSNPEQPNSPISSNSNMDGGTNSTTNLYTTPATSRKSGDSRDLNLEDLDVFKLYEDSDFATKIAGSNEGGDNLQWFDDLCFNVSMEMNNQ